MELSFIIIDDTELDHFIARKMINNATKKRPVRIESFLDASQALEHIQHYNDDGIIRVILVFLDIYMPLMNGFQFVEEFEKLDPAIQGKYYIVALTSSIEITDINRVGSYNAFKARITKPLSAEVLSALIDKIVSEYNLKLE